MKLTYRRCGDYHICDAISQWWESVVQQAYAMY